MSAERLRQAATLMRLRAEKAVPAGPWVVASNGRIVQHGDDFDVAIADAAFPGCTGTGWPFTASHIASWHPAVALAVADWLEMVASNVENYGPNAESPWVRPHVQKALAVANAYLGAEQ